MTKKHFNAMAETFRMERPGENWDANKRLMWNQMVKAMASTCRQFNSAFNRERFINACGGLFPEV